MINDTNTIKEKALNIVRTYRNLSIFGVSIKLNSVRKSRENYIIKGEYIDQWLADKPREEGAFVITLKTADLTPVSVKIFPAKKS